MKNFKLTKKVQIILATFLVVIVGTILVGIFSNDKVNAAATKPSCPICQNNANMQLYQTDASTHTYVCSVHGQQVSGSHYYVSGSICSVCGYERYEHTCTYDDHYENIGDETYHNCVCTCGKKVQGRHFYSEGVCTACGYKHTNHEWDSTKGSCSVCLYECRHTSKKTTTGREATCTEEGLTDGEYCATCNFITKNQETIPAKGHTVVIDYGRAPTCTETGLTEGKHCSVCNATIVAQEEIPALGHTEVVDPAVPATCTETGLTEGKHCSVCNATIVAQEEIPALGHTEVIDEGKPATCIESGLTEGKHCSVCNETIVAQEVIPARGHNYENGTCTECGEEQYSEVQITSDEYEIDDTYISKIQPGTTVSELKSNLETNATEITVYNNNEALSDTDKIGTGMTIELKNGNKTKTFTAIVRGDINGDGDADFTDIVKINQSRLHKITLDEIYSKAADVTDDNKVDLFDILKINMFRLHKITTL